VKKISLPENHHQIPNQLQKVQQKLNQTRAILTRSNKL